MTTITIPQAQLSPGQAPRIRHADADQIGEAVARAGEVIHRAGVQVETERLDREFARARTDIIRGLGQARLEMDTIGDPEAREAAWMDRSGVLRASVVDAADPRIRDRVGLAYDQIADSHGLAVGRDVLELRQSQQRVLIDNQQEAMVANAALSDPETRLAEYDQFIATVAAAQENGTLTPEEANTILKSGRDAQQRAAATRLLETDPGVLIERIDAGELEGMDPLALEAYRNRGLRAIERQDAATAAESARAQKEREQIMKGDLATVTAAARAGRSSGREAEILESPEYQAQPGFAEAAAAVALRDTLPAFATLPPTEMDRLIEEERAKPVSERHEIRILEAMETTRDAAREAWKSDPIVQAGEIEIQAPPELPDPAGLQADPQSFVNALTLRRNYGNSLAASGYVETPAYFSKAERDRLAALTQPDQSPEVRAQLSAMMATAFGPDLARAVAEIEGDEVFEWVGPLGVAMKDARVPAAAFKGQQMIAEKLVELPKAELIRSWTDDELAGVLADDTPLEGQVVAVATALYAASARGIDASSGDAKRLYKQSLQTALGATGTRRGVQAGGVQKVRGTMTLLPVGVTADEASDALAAAARRPEAWADASASGGAPVYNGRPIDADLADEVKLRAIGNGIYALYVQRRGGPIDLVDSETGGLYLVNLPKLAGGKR